MFSPAKITKIGVTYTSTNAKDYLIGVFQGANSKSFFDESPLYLIQEKLQPNQKYLNEIFCTQTLRHFAPEVKNACPSHYTI